MSVADREQLRELASLHALGVLSAEERAELAAAMAADPEFAAEVRQLEDTAGALGGVVAQIDPPARLRARVLAVAGIEENATASPAVVSMTGARGPARSDASATAGGRSSALPGWLAAAAALVLASGLGLWALQLRTSLEAMNARVDQAEARVDRAEAEVVRIQRTLGEAQSQTRVLQASNAVLFAPDTLRVDLAGEGPALAAKARAFMSPHSGVTFAANELPALPADRVYQLWVVPTNNQPPVSAGLLKPDASGHASLFFPMPAGLSAAALAVTVEPAGGVPAPTGARVLLGAVPLARTS